MNWVLGFSGGADSVCLWHKTQHLNPKIVYVNHNQSNQDKLEEEFCKNFAKKHNFHLIVENVFCKKGNFENTARNQRYSALAKHGDKILVGHHKDDNIETFFLRLFRGSGLRGLTGIKEIVEFENFTIYRPLLNLFKKDILNYCRENFLDWINDPTNFDNNRNRVFIRNTLIPNIETHYKDVKQIVSQTVNVLSEQEQLIDELALEDWNKFFQNNVIDLTAMFQLSFVRQKNAWMGFLNRNNIQNVKYRSVETYLKQLNLKNENTKISFKFGKYSFKQNKTKLEISYE